MLAMMPRGSAVSRLADEVGCGSLVSLTLSTRLSNFAPIPALWPGHRRPWHAARGRRHAARGRGRRPLRGRGAGRPPSRSAKSSVSAAAARCSCRLARSTGIGLGCKVEIAAGTPARFTRMKAWLGRVINALGEPIDGKGPLPQGRIAYPLRNRAAAGACAQARAGQDRSRRARAQHLPDLLPRPAHGHLRRLGRRQVDAAVDDRALHRGRRDRDRPGRRARPRGAGIHRGRSRPRRPGAQRRRRRDLG